MTLKRLIVGLVAAASLVGAGSAATAAPTVGDPSPAVIESFNDSLPTTIHPTWTRTCGFANCSVYLNKRETRIASYGGALLTQLLCSILNGTAAKLACTGISYLVGRAGDNAVASNRCVKISFSRWTGIPYYIGTYGPSWRCA